MPLAALAFAVSTAYLPNILSAAVAPRYWLLLVGAPILLLSRQVRMTGLHWLGLLFLCTIAASCFWSVSRDDTYVGLAQWVALAMVFCVASTLEDLTPVWLALGWGCLINTGVALFQFFYPDAMQTRGVAGLFYERDFYGAFCAITLIGMAYGVKTTFEKFNVKTFLVLVAFAGLVLSAARGAILAALAGLLVPLWLRQPWGKRLCLAAPGLLLAFGGAWLAFVLDPHRQEAITYRFAKWEWVLQNLRWFGWGWNTLGSVFPFEHADNDFVELLFDQGALVLVFAAFLVGLLRKARHAPGLCAVLVCVLVGSLTSSTLHNPATALVAAIVAGAVCNRRLVLRHPGLPSADASDLHPGIYQYDGATGRLYEA